MHKLALSLTIPVFLIDTCAIMRNCQKALLLLIMLWLPVEGTMAAMISLCTNLKELALVEQSFKLNATDPVSSKSSPLKCGQEKHASGQTDPDIPVADANDTAVGGWLSYLQCNDLLCKISYTTLTLILSNTVPITRNDAVNTPFLNTSFVSHVPEQSYRPPIG